jgi:hypothetical protein
MGSVKYIIEMMLGGMICIQFHDDWYRHSKLIMGGGDRGGERKRYTHTHTCTQKGS